MNMIRGMHSNFLLFSSTPHSPWGKWNSHFELLANSKKRIPKSDSNQGFFLFLLYLIRKSFPSSTKEKERDARWSLSGTTHPLGLGCEIYTGGMKGLLGAEAEKELTARPLLNYPRFVKKESFKSLHIYTHL